MLTITSTENSVLLDERTAGKLEAKTNSEVQVIHRGRRADGDRRLQGGQSANHFPFGQGPQIRDRLGIK
ncbi:hypothetical protein [Noviherbaspirillum massiliense]|uniref:hypothetical protein n=1 Tax=Noviherbaspirillum massiliense TaxID=1465823 RepID=UPI0004750BB8|nr:hypothetical protein [Noviherbaspirillum massiliense]